MTSNPEDGLPFIKMHGLGNDFIIIDARTRSLALTPENVRAMADRRTGVGCDQVIVIDPGNIMLIFNSDGGRVDACGNATRCVASLLMKESGHSRVTIETGAGTLEAWRSAEGMITVDMGEPGLDWREIPLAKEADSLHLPVSLGPLSDPVGVSMGNPHAVFFPTQEVDLKTLGPKIEHHPLFPERTNVEVVRVINRKSLRMRVWERGAGITRACGTGACAALVACVRRGLTERDAEVILDGGSLFIEWREDDNHVLMTGPVATSFTGLLPL